MKRAHGGMKNERLGVGIFGWEYQHRHTLGDSAVDEMTRAASTVEPGGNNETS
jgi:hypothetical protein